MHIAFTIPDLKGGGAQKMMINLVNEFANRGHHIDLVLVNKSGIYHDNINANVNVVDLNKKRVIAALFPLSHYIKKNSPDIMMSALFHMNLITLIAKIFSFSTKTKIVISERNNLSLRFSDLFFIKSFFLKICVKVLYPFSDKIIGISHGVCDDLRSFLKIEPSKIKTIYNPVVTLDFEQKINQDIESIFPKNCGLKLITSGRLVNQKDYPTLLCAVAHFNEKYGKAYLVILGDGPLKSDMIALANDLNINDNISFKGFVKNPLAYMKSADVFVIASAWEGFCNVIVEALYAGLKIVSTDCHSGPSEILEDGKYGELVAVGDFKELSKKIYKISKENVLSHNQKQRASYFTVEKKSDEFFTLFKDLLNAE